MVRPAAAQVLPTPKNGGLCRPWAYGRLIAPKNEAVQALRRSQIQYVQRREDLWSRSQGSPEDPPPQASPGSSKQQERRRRSREEAQAKVETQ